MSQPCHEISGGRSHQYLVCPSSQLYVTHTGFSLFIEQTGVDTMPGYGLKCQWRDKCLGTTGHDHAHICTFAAQAPNKISRLVSCNSARNAQQNLLACNRRYCLVLIAHDSEYLPVLQRCRE